MASLSMKAAASLAPRICNPCSLKTDGTSSSVLKNGRAVAGMHLSVAGGVSVRKSAFGDRRASRRGDFFGAVDFVPCLLEGSNRRTGNRIDVTCSVSADRPASQPRFIQHKQEAFWFYRFLSMVYDTVINPGHWTEDMRDDALEPAGLDNPNLRVVDVGGGTGFTTLGIVKTVDAKNVTILDQSPHQLEKARQKAPLKECTIIQGDAENLPFATDYADRYVSAGSIEYWPDPQRGIKEAYRVLKKGGKACLIGPVHPTHPVSRFFADVWMLFPTEEEYIKWFTAAGFSDVKLKRIGPKWYRGVRRHGLIMGCSVTGVKTEDGDSPLDLGPPAEDVSGPFNPVSFVYRFLLGTLASIYYVLIPIYMWIKDLIFPKEWKI
eukprot:TRINITY_DN20329_c0_g1_i1.p1 TRINITY_DN20329_c0_g1~~TRINITY_DN20329_c0_g1_i1.p1  ORF type:complete len:397 (+),score=57.65 TRINITY_DN20329_c0_g1_i1:60-1193(+)